MRTPPNIVPVTQEAPPLAKPQLLVHKLDPLAKLPERIYPSDVGFDIRAHMLSENGKPLTRPIPANGCLAINTGLALRASPGYYCQICSRSGWATKGVFVANAPGIIDPDYSGELKILLYNGSPFAIYVSHGMRIAQVILAPLCQADLAEVAEPFQSRERGDSGLGSSGED